MIATPQKLKRSERRRRAALRRQAAKPAPHHNSGRQPHLVSTLGSEGLGLTVLRLIADAMRANGSTLCRCCAAPPIIAYLDATLEHCPAALAAAGIGKTVCDSKDVYFLMDSFA